MCDGSGLFVNQGLEPFGQFRRYRYAVYAAGMLSGLSQNFLVGFGVDLGVAVETGIAAVKRFHGCLEIRVSGSFWVFVPSV